MSANCRPASVSPSPAPDRMLTRPRAWACSMVCRIRSRVRSGKMRLKPVGRNGAVVVDLRDQADQVGGCQCRARSRDLSLGSSGGHRPGPPAVSTALGRDGAVWENRSRFCQAGWCADRAGAVVVGAGLREWWAAWVCGPVRTAWSLCPQTGCWDVWVSGRPADHADRAPKTPARPSCGLGQPVGLPGVELSSPGRRQRAAAAADRCWSSSRRV